MSKIVYKRVNTDKELQQILEIQRVNYPTVVSREDRIKEGFVTVKHDFELLKSMNNMCAHIIAKHEDKVVGYALCMLKDFKNKIEVLKPMFQQIEICLKSNQTYIVMGQICIDKSYRKQGIFRRLYNYMKQQLIPEFDMIITEVDVANSRSLNAHYAIGFKLLHIYNSNNQEWALVCWE
ncbi:MAG: GNAT family N-acetyltransferase [Flavobacteriaceae bacterium]